MDLKNALILDGNDALSKALGDVIESGLAVIITKNGEYAGIIDDRNLRGGISDPSKIKCESVCVKSPSLTQASSLEERLNSFMAGHFKALPVLDQKGRILGAYTRADLLRELVALNILPKGYVRTLMSFPVFTLQHNDTVATAKKLMKENEVNHLVVIRNGRPTGVVSTHDFSSYLSKPKERQGRTFVSESTSPNEMVISNFMREEMPSVPDDALVEDAIHKMADGNFSSVLVLSGGTVKGVLSATDIFKWVLKLSSAEQELVISGLDEDDMKNYVDIKSAIFDVMNKFKKSFSMTNINMRFKKGKSVYNAQLHLVLDNVQVSLSAEEYTLKSVVDVLAKELHNVLVKKKSMVADKKISRPEGD